MENRSGSNEAITVKEFEATCRMLFEQRARCDEIKDALKEENKRLEKLEAHVLACLRDLDRDNFKSSFGTVSVVKKLSVTTPKTPEEKEAFFNYLKERGIFMDMVTVNSQTLNSFYKDEFEIAKEEGRLMEFSMPGIKEPVVYESLRLMKGKT